MCLVVGANDVVNPAARHDKSSPIYGMPIIDADKAHLCLAIKRGMSAGFAGIDNELYTARPDLHALRRRQGGGGRHREAPVGTGGGALRGAGKQAA